MAWSAKLQSGSGGVAGYNEFEMVYDAASQTAYKLKYGFNLGNQSPDVLYHTPDNGSPVPVRSKGNNRLIFLTFDIPPQADWDTIASKTAAIARLVDGPYSQAVRAQTRGDVEKVRVAIRPDGATYSTYFYVLTGFMDTAQAFSDPVAIINTMGRSITLALTCEPFGCGDTFTLSNGLASSPHFIVDTNGDGLADGWTESGTPTTTIETTTFLIGGSCQKVVGASAGDGVYSGQVSSTDNTAAYIWTRISTGTVVYKLRNVTDGSDITTKSLTAATLAANADKTATDSSGGVWRRVNLSGAAAGTKNVRIDTAASGGAATYFIDAAYIGASASTAPPAFSGAKTLTNNGINHLDFWGIPGDVPALINMGLTKTGTNDEGFIFGRRTDGKQLANAIRYRIESPTFAGGVFSVSSNYIRASSTGASDFYFANADNITPADDPAATARAIGDTIFKLYVVARSSSTTNTLYGQYSANGSTMIDTDTASATTADTWELWDLGIVNPTGLVVNQSLTSSFYLQFQATVTGTLDIDYVILMPVGDEYLIVDGNPYAIYGTLRQITYTVGYTASFLSTWRGSMWQIPAGPQMTRLVYHDFGASNAVTVGNTLAISATITPRTSHLLGVS